MKNGVQQQIRKGLLNQGEVQAGQRDFPGNLYAHCAPGQFVFQQTNSGLQEVADITPIKLGAHMAGVESRHIEQVADEAGEPCGGFFNL